MHVVSAMFVYKTVIHFSFSFISLAKYQIHFSSANFQVI